MTTNPVVASRLRRYLINEKKLSTICARLLSHLSIADHSIALTFVGPKTMRKLNSQFRHKDKSTDVLSFPQHQWIKAQAVSSRTHGIKPSRNGPPKILGDLVISLADAEKNARRIGQDLDREVCFLMIHGILHLTGHDHQEAAETKRMLRAQQKLLDLMRGKGATPLWRHCVRLRAN